MKTRILRRHNARGGAVFRPGEMIPTRAANFQVHPLAQYWASGAMPVYLSLEEAELDGSGDLTKLINAGSGGATFDATVAGGAVPVAGGGYWGPTSGTVVPTFATALDLTGKVLLAVVRDMSPANGEQLGGSAGASQYMIRWTSTGTDVGVQFFSNETGSSVSPSTSRVPIATVGSVILTAFGRQPDGTMSATLDQNDLGSVDGSVWTAFLISTLGRGTNGNFDGEFGDLAVVDLSAPDAQDAMDAFAAYTQTKYGWGSS